MGLSYEELLLELAELTEPRAVEESIKEIEKAAEKKVSATEAAYDSIKQFSGEITHLEQIKSEIFGHFKTVSTEFKAHKDQILKYRTLLSELTELSNLYSLTKQDPPNLVSVDAAICLLELLCPDYFNSTMDTFVSMEFQNLTQEQELFAYVQAYYAPIFKNISENEFASESLFVEALVENVVGPEMSLYELIHYLEDQLRVITSESSLKDFTNYKLLSSTSVRQITKQLFITIGEQTENLFGMFVYRYFGLIERQYDIVFMQSAEYDRTKAVKMQAAVQFVIEQAVQYFSGLFEVLDLELFAPNYLEAIPQDFSLIVEQPCNSNNMAQRLLNGGIGVSKKVFEQVSAFVKTNSENPQIKLLFSRYYPANSEYCALQIVIDLLARIIYRIMSKACENMGLKHADFESEYGHNLSIMCSRGAYGEFVSRTIEQIVDTVGAWLSEGRE